MMKKTVLSSMMALVVVGLAIAAGQGDQKAPAVETKPTLRFLWRDATFDLPKDPGVQIFEKVTGYKVEWNAVPAGADGQRKVTLEMAAGEKYDLVQTSSTLGIQLIGQGIMQPMDDLIGKQGTNVRKALPDSVLSVGRLDGKQMALPLNIANRGFSTKALLVRQDLLDKNGLKQPRTVEELYAALKTLKENEKNLVPLTYDAGINGTSVPLAILSGFGSTGDWMKVGGAWTAPVKQKAMQDAVTFMAKLYAEGLLDPEMPAMKRASKVEKFTAGKAAFIDYDAWESGILQPLLDTVPGSKYVYIPVLENSAGKGFVLARAGYENFTMMPKNAPNPVHAMRWINATLDDVNFLKLYLGTEGVTYQVKDGAYFPILPAFNDHNSIWFYFVSFVDNKVADYWQARARKSPLVAESYLTVDKLNAAYEQVSPLAFAPKFKKQAELSASVNQYVNDEILKFIVGARPMSDWNVFLGEYDKKGGAEIDDEIAVWLNANAK